MEEKEIKGTLELTVEKHTVKAREISKWSMVVAAIWIGGLTLLRAFWGLISITAFGLDIWEIIISGLALAAVFTPIYFSIFMDKLKDIKLGVR